MSSHPFSPWLDLVRSALPALGQFGGELPAAQAQWARFVKSTLDFGKEWRELQSAAAFALLQAQLAMLGGGGPARAAHGLLDLQLGAIGQLAEQWKTLSDGAASRNDACIDALHLARNEEDVSFVMAGFLRDGETVLRKSAGDAAMAANAAGAAAGLLTHRLLDELIAQPQVQPKETQAQD